MSKLEQLVKGSNDWYTEAYRIMAYDPGQAEHIVRAANRVYLSRERYRVVAEVIGCPWWFVGGIHNMEASCDFRGILHNGERIIGAGRKTSLVPIGRGPFSTWEGAAVDALRMKGFNLVTDWSIGNTLRLTERYNGTGYLRYHPEENSPYLWAKSTLNDGRGKYVADGRYDTNAPSESQVGFACIVKELERQRRIEIAA